MKNWFVQARNNICFQSFYQVRGQLGWWRYFWLCLRHVYRMAGRRFGLGSELRFLRTPLERINGLEITAFAQFHASMSSAKYFLEHFDCAKNCEVQDVLLHYCAKLPRPKGLCMEFGVYTGSTIKILSKSCSEIWGFDSFHGVDANWRSDMDMRHFDLSGSLPRRLPKNVQLVVGLIEDTLPVFLREHPEPAALVHIDTDIYASAKTILQALQGRIVVGSILIFDEYWNYPHWEKHEFKAWQEFVQEHSVTYEYIAFASSHLSVAVRVLRVG